jgi:hypothetical protein
MVGPPKKGKPSFDTSTLGRSGEPRSFNFPIEKNPFFRYARAMAITRSRKVKDAIWLSRIAQAVNGTTDSLALGRLVEEIHSGPVKRIAIALIRKTGSAKEKTVARRLKAWAAASN